MSIPLVQEATKDAINTSIIAIKRNIERINMLLGLSNSEEIDTSEFVKKSDIVDEVTVGNMQSVTSNAVAEAISYSETEHQVGYYSDCCLLYERTFSFNLTGTSSGDIVNFNLPSEFANYYVVKIEATLERNNYTLVSGMNKYFSVWKGSYTTITIQQEMTGTTTNLIAFVHLFYEKA